MQIILFVAAWKKGKKYMQMSSHLVLGDKFLSVGVFVCVANVMILKSW